MHLGLVSWNCFDRCQQNRKAESPSCQIHCVFEPDCCGSSSCNFPVKIIFEVKFSRQGWNLIFFRMAQLHKIVEFRWNVLCLICVRFCDQPNIVFPHFSGDHDTVCGHRFHRCSSSVQYNWLSCMCVFLCFFHLASDRAIFVHSPSEHEKQMSENNGWDCPDQQLVHGVSWCLRNFGSYTLHALLSLPSLTISQKQIFCVGRNTFPVSFLSNYEKLFLSTSSRWSPGQGVSEPYFDFNKTKQKLGPADIY